MPSGDVAFIAYTDLCPELPSRTQLLDAEGREVALAFEEVAPGVVSARTEMALLPGNYEIRTSANPTGPVDDTDAAATAANPPGPVGDPGAPAKAAILNKVTALVVAEPTPLPTTLGTLQVALRGCGEQQTLTLSLALAPEMEPYADLLRLTAILDGASVPLVLAEFGQARGSLSMQADGSATLTRHLGTCGAQWPCGLSGNDVTVEVFGNLAGEEGMRPYSVSQTINAACPESPPPEAACDMPGPAGRGPFWPAALGLLLAATARRRKRRPEHIHPLSPASHLEAGNR